MAEELKTYYDFADNNFDFLPEVKLDRQSLNLVNGLYFTTRYPGDESILVEKEDLDDYMDAVRKCKKAVDDFIKSRNE